VDTFDVVVIGGGAAGAAAALSAARAGARAALVRRGPGAAALTGGGWHGAPPQELRAALTAAGHELIDCDAPLPHPDGSLISCAVAPVSSAQASLDANAHDVLVCGVAGLPSFRASALAALWADAAGARNESIGAATITIDATPPAGWSAVALAALLDREPERLVRPLAALVRDRGAARVIVPAVLGLAGHARVLAAVMDGTGVSAGEALGVAPSVPGWRLDRALMNAVTGAGVIVIGGRVVRGLIDGSAVRSVSVAGAGGRSVEREHLTQIAGECFVLATGKYIAGGITADIEFEEPALGCDVALERFARTIDDPGAALVLTDPERSEPQPVLSAGVRVSGDGRPLTPADDVFLSNVFVAGSVRAGTETATLGLGAAAHDGWEAGARAAAHASRAGSE
jgi:anaerobic glycerol-3-phosphate dehydrogenase